MNLYTKLFVKKLYASLKAKIHFTRHNIVR
jgi:hypothetical protein